MALLIILAFLTWQIRRTALPGRRAAALQAVRGRKIEAAVLAGLVATVEMGMVQIIVLAIFTELPASVPERVLRALVALSPAGYGVLPSPLTAPGAACCSSRPAFSGRSSTRCWSSRDSTDRTG